MRKILMTTAALVGLTFAANAQSDAIKYGVKAGYQSTNFSEGEGDARSAFYVGGLVDLPVQGNFHVQAELLYSAEGNKYEIGSVEFKNHVDYLRIPVLAKYYVMEGLALQAGPNFGFKIAEEDGMEVNGFDFGLSGGATYEFPMGLFIDARYNAGMTKIADGTDAKNQGFAVGLGYRFYAIYFQMKKAIPKGMAFFYTWLSKLKTIAYT